MWVNYPNMPTGAPASLELFDNLVNFGRRHSIVICNDNPYSFILNPNKLSIFSVKGAKEIAIEMNLMSKSHNMVGWRVGMCVSNPEFMGWIQKVKSNVDSGSFRGIHQAAIAAYNNSEEWHKAQNQMYATNRLIAEQIFNTFAIRYDKSRWVCFSGVKCLLTTSTRGILQMCYSRRP